MTESLLVNLREQNSVYLVLSFTQKLYYDSLRLYCHASNKMPLVRL